MGFVASSNQLLQGYVALAEESPMAAGSLLLGGPFVESLESPMGCLEEPNRLLIGGASLGHT